MMTVKELIAKLSEVDDLNRPVCLGGDGAKCIEVDDNLDSKEVYIYFYWED
jgi:hypothetical protein